MVGVAQQKTYTQKWKTKVKVVDLACLASSWFSNSAVMT